MLTETQKQLRHGRIGASFVPALMAGDEPTMLREWMRLVEHPDYVEEDLGDNWAVQFGSYIEAFALDWHQRKTGRELTNRGGFVPHPTLPYLSCTLDAYRPDDATVIDCKAPGRWRVLDDVLTYYPGQLVVQKACMHAQNAALLIVHGGDEPTEYACDWTDEYESEVWTRLAWFWDRVNTLEPPCAIPAAKGSVKAVRTVDMSRSNTWATAAAQWINNKQAAGLFNRAAKDIKGLIQDDVARAYGAGIEATRNRAGALTIKEM